jgi:hypothetical protein
METKELYRVASPTALRCFCCKQQSARVVLLTHGGQAGAYRVQCTACGTQLQAHGAPRAAEFEWRRVLSAVMAERK